MKHTDNLELWFTDLEATTLPQGTGQMGDTKAGLCCLGLGCNTAGIEFESDEPLPSMAFPLWLDSESIPMRRTSRHSINSVVFEPHHYLDSATYNIGILTKDIDWTKVPQRMADHKAEIIERNQEYMTFSEFNDGITYDESEEQIILTFAEIAAFGRAHVEHLFFSEQ
jgi:hypothetical protein